MIKTIFFFLICVILKENINEDVDNVDKTIENIVMSILGNKFQILEPWLLNGDEVNSIYEKTMDGYKEKKDMRLMPSYDLNISQLTTLEVIFLVF